MSYKLLILRRAQKELAGLTGEPYERVRNAIVAQERDAFLEDLLAATSPEYIRSIEEARADYKMGRVKTPAEVLLELHGSWQDKREADQIIDEIKRARKS